MTHHLAESLTHWSPPQQLRHNVSMNCFKNHHDELDLTTGGKPN